jgi:hypothetical protein
MVGPQSYALWRYQLRDEEEVLRRDFFGRRGGIGNCPVVSDLGDRFLVKKCNVGGFATSSKKMAGITLALPVANGASSPFSQK